MRDREFGQLIRLARSPALRNAHVDADAAENAAVPEAATFAARVRREAIAVTAAEATASAGTPATREALAGLTEAERLEIGTAAADVADRLRNLRDAAPAWAHDAASDTLNGNAARWDAITETTRRFLDAFDKRKLDAGELDRVTIEPAGLELNEQVERDARAAAAALRTFWRASAERTAWIAAPAALRTKRYLRKIAVEGTACDTPDGLEKLAHIAGSHRFLTGTSELWEAVGATPLHGFEAACGTFRERLKVLTDAFETATAAQHLSELIATSPELEQPPHWDDERAIKDIAAAVGGVERDLAAAAAIADVDRCADPAQRDSESDAALRRAVHDRDDDAYADAAAERERRLAVNTALTHRERLLEKLCADGGAGAVLAREIRARPDDPAWEPWTTGFGEEWRSRRRQPKDRE